MFDIITIGDTTLDILLTLDEATLQKNNKKHTTELCLQYGDKIPVHNVMKTAGGNAANVAAGMSKLGLTAALVSEIGADTDAHVITDQLKKTGVDLTYLKKNKKNTSKTNYILNFQSERTILSTPANHRYHLPKLPPTKLVYLTSMHAGAEKIYSKMLASMKKNPATQLATNPGSYQLREGLKDYKKILARAAYLFVNCEEATQIVGKRLPPHKLLVALQKYGPSTIFMTNGSQGSYAAQKNEQFFLQSFPQRATNKVGAGDAFASGALAALLYGKSLPVAMAWGTANATGVISKLGAQLGLLSHFQLSLMLRRYRHIKPSDNLPPQS